MTDIESIDQWLPQTQCTRCGYPDCRAYAAAVAGGEAGIDRCPPGGRSTLGGLATLLGVDEPAGLAEDVEPFEGFATARIREHECIGCTKCIEACPVDAIIGSGKKMHTVIESDCTGCELCLPPCPVDCIDLATPRTPFAPSRAWPAFPAGAAARYRAARERRRGRERRNTSTTPVRKESDHLAGAAREVEAEIRQRVLDAVARSRARRRQANP